MVSRTWLKDSWDALRQILEGWKVNFVAYSWSSVINRQTKLWPMSQWRGRRWYSRFGHCATSQKLVGSTPDGDIEIFY